MPNLIIGAVPRGADYFGREGFIESLWSKLEHDNLLLVAPRRFGKTGAMYRLLDEPRGPFRPIYLNVEHLGSANNFMVELLAALLRDRHFTRIVAGLWEETKDFARFLRDLPQEVQVGALKMAIRERTDVAAEWFAYGERLVGLLARDEPRPLLLIDELPILVANIARRDAEEARRFLRWFRVARTAPGTRTRFVVGGSVSLVASLDELGLVDTISDLMPVALEAFDRATAESYVRAVFEDRGLPLRRDIAETVLEIVGEPIPFLLAVLLSATFDRLRKPGETLTPELVRATFEEDVLGGGTSAVFQHYRSRIDQYYSGREGPAALSLLGLLSRAEAPVERTTLYHSYLQGGNRRPSTGSEESFRRLMNRLENDFYVVRQDGGYAFHSRVLQLWWSTHYGYQYE